MRLKTAQRQGVLQLIISGRWDSGTSCHFSKDMVDTALYLVVDTPGLARAHRHTGRSITAIYSGSLPVAAQMQKGRLVACHGKQNSTKAHE